jgi:polyphosphate kinase
MTEDSTGGHRRRRETTFGGIDALLNRELSWIDFDRRVLAQADDDQIPLLERLKFVAISASNLDEFFQVRVAALKDQIAAEVTQPSPDGRTPAGQLIEILDAVRGLVADQERVLLNDLLPQLRSEGVGLCDWAELSIEEQKQLIAIFDQRVFPVLTPLAVDPGHPFPYISNLSLNLGVMVRDPATNERRFTRLKVAQNLPRYIRIPDTDRFLPLEQLIASQLASLFPGMHVESQWAFRVIRNADLFLDEDEADDLLEAVETELRRRRFGRAVRLEVEVGMSDEMIGMLLDELDLERDDVSRHQLPLDLNRLFVIHSIDRFDLKDEPWPVRPVPELVQATLDRQSMFAVLRERDVLLHHPYQSFGDSVETFIAQAADDPRVLSIKMTLYRTSGDSPIARSLIRAAERGVQVAALIELKARFDEEANISWARKLEQAGVHVVYGLAGLKTHTKCVLVVRDDADGLRRYAHLGTGNYNTRTARLYEDIGLLTADPEITADLGELFNHLTGYSRQVGSRRILVAPTALRDRLIELIGREASYGEAGEIVIKVNSLADPRITAALYRASQAGVSVQLIVRGVCVLRPGVAGLSERITVRSILGRYLEHSRVFRFAHGTEDGEPLYLIGSADLMPRNLDRRVEVLVPVTDIVHRRQLEQLLRASLDADTISWQLAGDGTWTRTGTVDVQEQLAAGLIDGT